MPSFTLTGGPCHWDLHVQLYVAVGVDLARNEGILGADGRISDFDRLSRLTRALMRQMQAGFDSVFNPNIANGEWTLYPVAPCCSFHISIDMRPLPDDWTGLQKDALRTRLPPGWGVAMVERLDREAPHADIGGTFTVLDAGAISGHHTAHEIGHLLGLPDRHRHAHNHDEVTPAVHRANRGRLMGIAQFGRRTVHETEVAEIASATGMTCDRRRCCGGANRDGEEGAGTTRERRKAHDAGGVIDILEKPKNNPKEGKTQSRPTKKGAVRRNRR
jgi:hypothetical protein